MRVTRGDLVFSWLGFASAWSWSWNWSLEEREIVHLLIEVEVL
jgi:hypothetical protein